MFRTPDTRTPMTQEQLALVAFYEECQKNGYTDMKNPDHQIKAKVIAMDRNLTYGNFEKFYAQAEKLYTAYYAEKRRLEIPGTLLFTAECGEDRIAVYRREDRTYYSETNGKDRTSEIPKFYAERWYGLSYTYNPSEAIFTAATVGGVTTGGVDYTKPSTSTHVKETGNGSVLCDYKGKKKIDVKSIVFSDDVDGLFKRDADYVDFVRDKIAKCYGSELSASDLHYEGPRSGGANEAAYNTAMARAVDKTRLPLESCTRIVRLLNKVIRMQCPPSEEELYRQAVHLEGSNRYPDVAKAAELFHCISNYKDAFVREQEAVLKMQSLEQGYKEEQVLEKEKARKKKKVRRAILIPVCIVGTILLFYGLFKLLIFFVSHM